MNSRSLAIAFQRVLAILTVKIYKAWKRGLYRLDIEAFLVSVDFLSGPCAMSSAPGFLQKPKKRPPRCGKFGFLTVGHENHSCTSLRQLYQEMPRPSLFDQDVLMYQNSMARQTLRSLRDIYSHSVLKGPRARFYSDDISGKPQDADVRKLGRAIVDDFATIRSKYRTKSETLYRPSS